MIGGDFMGFKMPKGISKVPMTIRVEETDYQIIEKIAKESKKSLNDVVCAMIRYSIENMD